MSEALDPASLSESTVIVKINGRPVTELEVDPVNFTLSSDGLTATYQHPGGLFLLATYEITLTTGITDLAGNPLAADFKWSFTVRDGIWSDTAYSVSTDDEYEKHNPQVAFDAQGKANIIWCDDYDTQEGGPYQGDWFSVRYSRYNASQEKPWSEPGFVSSISSECSSYDSSTTIPQIASSMRGTSFSVWPGGGGEGNTYIYGARFKNNAWETDEMLPELPEEYINSGVSNAPHVAVDKAGNAMAIWANFADYEYVYIFTSRYDSKTSSWESTELISDVELDAFSPRIASGASNGDMVAVWTELSSESLYTVYASIYDADAAEPGWSAPTPISSSWDSYPQPFPQIAIDSEGNAIAVWEGAGEGTGIFANFYDATSGDWLGENIIYSGVNPQVAFDPLGNAIIIWETGGEGIYATRYDAGTDWWSWNAGELMQLLSNESSAENPKLVIDSLGNAIVVWEQQPSNYEIAFNRYRFVSEGFAWEYEGGEVLYSSTDEIRDLSIGIGPTGKAIAAWIRYYWDIYENEHWLVETKVFE